MLTQQGDGGSQLFFADGAGAAEHDAGSGFHLVGVELAEVFQIDLALRRVRDSDKAS